MGQTKRETAFQIRRDRLDLLRRVHVNMPWKFLPQYLEPILELHMNLEIGFDADELDRVPRKEMGCIMKRLSSAGCSLTLHAPFWDLNPGSADLSIRQVSRFRIQQFLDTASFFHPIQVVCHTGFDPRHHTGHKQLWLEQSISFWEAMVERAERMETPLLLENVWENGPETHRKLFEEIDSDYFGFCLDVGHQNSFSGTPLSVWLEELGDFLKEIHVHDNDGAGDSHLPVGQGNIDFEFLFGFLRSKAKEPILTVEPHCESHLAETLEGLARVLGDEG